MDNNGKITVFLTLLISSLVLLGTTVLYIADIQSAKVKTALCGRTAVSSVKATYNEYIFEHYHVLLFDKSCSGLGEGYLEESIVTNMQDNLGKNYKVEDASIVSVTPVMEEDNGQFMKQIEDYMLMAAIDNSIQIIAPKDVSISTALSNEIKTSGEKKEEEIDCETQLGTASNTYKDPRTFVKNILSANILYFVLPDNMSPSIEEIDVSDVPSREYGNNFLFHENSYVDTDFDNVNSMLSDMKLSDFKNDALENGVLIAYINKVFNCALNTDINDSARFAYEREYLISGRSADADNLEVVANKIVTIRLPLNFTYLCGCKEKMDIVKTISSGLALVSPVPEAVYRYLIAGAWAYIESVADVRYLLHDKKLPLKKTDECWHTDINYFETSDYSQAKSYDEGLSYEDYLNMLMVMDIKNCRYRIFDLMEINARQQDDNFKMKNAVTGISVDIDVSYEGINCSTNITMSY